VPLTDLREFLDRAFDLKQPGKCKVNANNISIFLENLINGCFFREDESENYKEELGFRMLTE
jgi:hypothetical protein